MVNATPTVSSEVKEDVDLLLVFRQPLGFAVVRRGITEGRCIGTHASLELRLVAKVINLLSKLQPDSIIASGRCSSRPTYLSQARLGKANGDADDGKELRIPTLTNALILVPRDSSPSVHKLLRCGYEGNEMSQAFPEALDVRYLKKNILLDLLWYADTTGSLQQTNPVITGERFLQNVALDVIQLQRCGSGWVWERRKWGLNHRYVV
jgi:hypothetical protein